MAPNRANLNKNFVTTFVPLRLRSNVNCVKRIIWQNPVPSSPRYCRPIRIRFIRETKDVTNEEIEYVENQVKTLRRSEVPVLTNIFHIRHIMVPTMVDAKVCNAATDTSSTMRCYICGDTSKNFNNLTHNKEVNPEALKFGLSILHARIRFFEFLLHLAYKLPIKKWQVRDEEDKKIVSETKDKNKKSFWEEKGLLVDMPKAGVGNSNDGNTSRRFFADPAVSAQITGVDVQLIKKFEVILEAISTSHDIDVDKFSKYTLETANLYMYI